MFIVSYRPKGALHIETQYFGPFADYLEADDFLAALPAAINCEHKFIVRLTDPVYDDNGDAVTE